MDNKDYPAMPLNQRMDSIHLKDQPHCNGLTKREYMATQIAAGLFSGNGSISLTDAAREAVIGADLLLAELDK